MKQSEEQVASVQLENKNKVPTIILYLVKDLLLYYGIAFLFFFVVFFVNQILLMVQDVLKQKVPIVDVFKLIFYSLPFVISQSAPFATLVGFLVCFGRMITDNEILVLRALGFSYIRILVPVLIVGTVISCLSFVVNDILMPKGTIEYNRLYRKMLVSNPGVALESNSVKRLKNSVLVIGNVDGTNVSDLLYFDIDKYGNVRIITAEDSVVLQPPDPAVLMQIQMNSAIIFLPASTGVNDLDYVKTDSTVLNVLASDFGDFAPNGVNPREMTVHDLKQYIKKLRSDPSISAAYVNIFDVEYYRKYALPFSAIFFALLAMPLAFVFGKHNGQTVGFIIGVLICVVYWALQTLGQIFGQKNGLNAFWAMWIPDIVLGVFSVPFYIRMLRT
ncbi:MAG: LptF/LptG family permease [Spirochaetaceae bacterium]|nr:LptF/LptG family permease [Spirochaetaceae bacterium]